MAEERDLKKKIKNQTSYLSTNASSFFFFFGAPSDSVWEGPVTIKMVIYK